VLIRPSALTIAIAAHAVVIGVLVLIPRDTPAAEPETIAIETVPAVIAAPPVVDKPRLDPVPDPMPPRVVVKRAPRVKARVVRDEPAPGPKSPDPDPAPAAGGPGDEGGGSGSGSGAGGDGSGGGGGAGGGGDGDPDLSARAIPIDTESARTLPYTKEAMRDHVEGDVTLILSIDPTGNVSATRLHRGIGHGLDEIAANVARRFRFKPALDRRGNPTLGTVKWRFHFTRPG